MERHGSGGNHQQVRCGRAASLGVHGGLSGRLLSRRQYPQTGITIRTAKSATPSASSSATWTAIPFGKDDLLDVETLSPQNKFILALLDDTVDEVRKAYNEYRFSDAVNLMVILMTNELSSYYLDYAKDIL